MNVIQFLMELDKISTTYEPIILQFTKNNPTLTAI